MSPLVLPGLILPAQMLQGRCAFAWGMFGGAFALERLLVPSPSQVVHAGFLLAFYAATAFWLVLLARYHLAGTREKLPHGTAARSYSLTSIFGSVLGQHKAGWDWKGGRGQRR
jgi:hypothetical protein